MGIPTTVQEAIEEAAQVLGQAEIALGQGTLNAYDEAAWLVLSALGMPLDSDDEHLLAALPTSQWQTIQSWLHRRTQERVPYCVRWHGPGRRSMRSTFLQTPWPSLASTSPGTD